MMEHKLPTPIMVLDTMIDVIRMREPTGHDLMGLPLMEDDGYGFGIKLADRLATNVPVGTVENLPAFEAMQCAKLAMNSIIPTDRASSSTPISSSPGGGTTSESST